VHRIKSKAVVGTNFIRFKPKKIGQVNILFGNSIKRTNWVPAISFAPNESLSQIKIVDE
jgi:hypothetical protein